ncbi:hypothetical protein LBW12_02615 [Latilactobacillus curvatus]|uniref:hypothetical protein n=1 Tax=Latilactobacillus curvatus TaxID=28038 RepID=UPI0020C82D2B|nr:hypothetical protein [Latilactobacillus curvatus]MCP8858918.1 hypothetical protein [Latilactobacillus curvatus]
MNEDNIAELIEIVGADVETEIGNDDFVFGNYIEWPKLENLDSQTFAALVNYFEIIEDYDDDNRDEIIREMEDMGMPNGDTVYENGGEMDEYPESYKYFQADEFIPLDWVKYMERMNALKISFKSSNSSLIKKALLLAMMALTESYANDVTNENVKSAVDGTTNDVLKTFITKKIEDDMKREGGRKEIIKTFVSDEIKAIPEKIIRNKLAHDIGSKQLMIDGDVITLINKGEPENTNIDKVWIELVDYADLFYQSKK